MMGPPDFNSAFLKFINGGNNTVRGGQQASNSNASSANKIETTSGDTKPKENAKGRFSCKLCDKNSNLHTLTHWHGREIQSMM